MSGPALPHRPSTHGIDGPTMRFLDFHETRAHAIGGRTMHDHGDCVLLHAPRDRDPFFNRVAAVRWPEAPGAFDDRLAEIIALFAGLDRRPHVWTSSAFNVPADLGTRLEDHGFRDTEGGYVMLLVRPPPDRPLPIPSGIEIERLTGGPDAVVPEATLREIARVLAESFAVGVERVGAIEVETLEALTSPVFHVALVRVDGRPVAIGKRYTFDGASYLSSIGTRPGHRGLGLGTLVTEVLIRDSLAAASRHVYLGVHTHNDRAIAVYRRTGLEILGERAGDYLLG